MAGEEIIGYVVVGFGSYAARIVLEDGFSVAGCFSYADGARDDGIVELGGEVVGYFIDDLAGEIGPAVIHGHNDTF